MNQRELEEARRAGREARQAGMRRDQKPYFQIMQGIGDELTRAATLAGEWLRTWRDAA